MEKEFEMGPLQKMWITSLRKHPERQTTHELGKGTPRNYTACCLGELHLCAYRMKKKKLPFYNGLIKDDNRNAVLSHSYEKYGLKSESGSSKISYMNEDQLSAMNDNGATWTEIADLIENNPEAFFDKSV